MKPAPTLRARLLWAFALVAVPPTLLLAGLLVQATSTRLESDARERLQRRLRAARLRVEHLRQRADAQVAAVLADDLPAAGGAMDTPPGEPWLASRLAARRDLPALELLDASDHVLSSAHFPAGLGLLDRDGLLPNASSLRFERVGQDYGVGERLAVVAAARGTWRGAPVVVRGGFFLDSDWLRELAGVMQADVALRDQARQRWLAPPESVFAEWTQPAPGDAGAAATGEAWLRHTPYRWAGEALAPGLLLVAAEPRLESRVLLAGVRRAALVGLALALAAALGAAFWLAGRLTRPVSALASGARRIADGDLEASVPIAGPREIAALARDFNRMSDALRASQARLMQSERVAAWREMARRLAHELKNPLFPIQLSVETLRRELDRPATERGATFATLFRDASDTILLELRSLRRIIDGFSEFARMPAPALAATDVNACVRQVAALYGPSATEARLELELAEPAPCVPADAALLERALGNLVKNALEAMPGGGRLRLRTYLVPEGVAIDVCDEGPGLDADQRTRLFTPDYTTKPGGSGLGLAIVQGIVSDHGGRIVVHSQHGQGTIFSLVFPSAATATYPSADSDSGSDLSKTSD
jgi:signal transduction histidine kinase